MFNHPVESTIINSSEITGTVVQVDHHCHLKAWHLSPTCAGGHLRCLSHLENGEHHLLTPGEVGDITVFLLENHGKSHENTMISIS